MLTGREIAIGVHGRLPGVFTPIHKCVGSIIYRLLMAQTADYE